MVLALLPGYRILDARRIGPFGEWILTLEAQALELMLWGSVVAIGGGFAIAILFDTSRLRRGLENVGSRLASVPAPRYALVCAAIATGLGMVLSQALSQGLPTNVDSIASLVHARFLAEGMLAGPAPEVPASQLILNTLLTEEGWVSFYPPLHPALLALGLLLGAPFIVGPVMTGITVWASVRLVIELLPKRPRTARLAGALTAFSPFVLFLGSSYLSHTSAAAGIALAAWFGHRALNGRWYWAVGAGAAAGFAVFSRPWTGLVVCGGILSLQWISAAARSPNAAGWVSTRVTGAAVGGLPFALAFLGYNAHIFGNAFRLGYAAAYGPSHGLGFHTDPWGFPYGLREAIGYTAADLSSLSLHLLETPIPAVALVGLYLITTQKIDRGIRVLLAWGLLPLVANFFYWHHGFQMGPRMLFEAAPAWCALTAVSAVELASGEGFRIGKFDRNARGASLRDVTLLSLLLGALSASLLIPGRISANAWEGSTIANMTPPEAPTTPALMFVHGSWSERVSARLRTTGMRMDSVEVALRRNDLCKVDEYSRARLAERDPLPNLDFTLKPTTPDYLISLEVSEGNTIRRDADRELSSTCKREISADRFGTVSLAPLLWQGNLPGMNSRKTMFVRDFGPQANVRIYQSYPEHALFVLADTGGIRPQVMPYDEAMDLLWETEQPPPELAHP